MYALAADSAGVLYAGGTFIDMDGILAADYVAALDGSGWHALGTSAVTGTVRGLAASGTDVYVGSDGSNIAGIAQADHVAKWNGADWSALGSDAAGTNGWFQTPSFVFEDMAVAGSQLFVTGTFRTPAEIRPPTTSPASTAPGIRWAPTAPVTVR